MTAPLVSGGALLVVLLLMLAELRLSRTNERRLHAAGAIEAPDEVYPTMRWAYPATFVAMALEGAVSGATPGVTTAAGALLLAAAKLFKGWAIASLGARWTYKVLVLPDSPLVTRGPYALMRHPNYVAVLGELAGMALLVGAVVTGTASLALFGWLLHRRIRAEERALGMG